MSERKIRTFIAVELSIDVRKKLEEVLQSLEKVGAHMKCVKAANAHLTLRFLGATEESKLDEIKKTMGEAVEGISSFNISFHGVGAFPKIETPRVVWIAASDGKEKLREIRDLLEENLSQIGIEKEDREYHSHLTLARVKSQRGKNTLVSWIRSNENLDLGSMKVEKIVLMESILKTEGAEYRPLSVVSLQ